MTRRIAIIGYGEVGGIFAHDLRARGASSVSAYDTDPAARERARAAGDARAAASPGDALAGAETVIVAVTAGSVLNACRSLAGSLGHAPFVLDVNSVSPSTKQEAARIIARAGGRYVEAAVMSSVPPKGLGSPMLLGGPHATDFIEAMRPFGMDMRKFSDEIGRASSVKMCRSIMIKGLEALTTECMLTARHYGVEREVLATLGDTLPHEDWPKLARYVISRALIHGRRRAEEMREVARTVEEAGVAPLLSRPIAERQDWAWRQGRAMGREGRDTADLDRLLDALTEAMHLDAAAVRGSIVPEYETRDGMRGGLQGPRKNSAHAPPPRSISRPGASPAMR
jgi:3-hydroxyisobutyrate dehydrogenase-like beta-hydroxyacid dehydrogenase